MTARIYKIDAGLFALDDQSEKAIYDAGFKLIETPCRTAKDIIENCDDAAALMVTVEPVTSDVLAALSRLKIVARCGVGVDTVDVKAATQHGIQVTNVPDANIAEVAIHTLAMALAMTRRLHQFDSHVRLGNWSGDLGKGMRRPSSQTFGIIGFGRIGEAVGQLALAAGFRVVVSTPLASEEERARRLGATPVSFQELIAQSDIVSLHVPLLDSTRNIIDHDALVCMKQGSHLINVSRGGLVDEGALASHLNSGHLAGAALDVFSIEPLPGNSPLRAARNLLLSPHVAYLSADSLREVSRKMTSDVISVLRGAEPVYPVNSLSE